MTNYRKAFGNLLRSLRRARRLAQQAVAELLGEKIKDSQISRYEHGINLPRHRSNVEELADAIGCSVVERQRLLTAFAQAKAEDNGTDDL